MKQVFINALVLLDRRIKSCGRALAKSQDETTIQYWQNQLKLAQNKRFLVMRRSKLQYNVIHVDFQSRKRVA